MDEPGVPPPETDPQRGLLPTLIFAWIVLYLALWLGIGWHACFASIEPLVVLKIHALSLGSLALLFLYAFATARRPPSVAREPEAWLCQHCLRPYVPGAHFCPRCGAPKTFYSGVPDYERAYAQAWILGKAARCPSRLAHPVVLTVIAAVEVLQVIVWILLALDTWEEPWLSWAAVNGGGLLLTMLIAGIFVALMASSWCAWRRRAREEPPICPEIEYGAPPWFTRDAEWALPEFEEEPEGGEPEPTPAAG